MDWLSSRGIIDRKVYDARPDRFSFMDYAEKLTNSSRPSKPLSHIFSLARSNCVSLVTEEQVDADQISDSKNELSLLESLERPPHKWSRKIYRISFLRAVEDHPLPNAIDIDWFLNSADHSFECLGYCILFVDTKDDCTLRSYVPEALMIPPAQRGYVYIHCKTRVEFEVFGKRFQVMGSFFVQQCGAIWCCAHAATRACLSTLNPTNVPSIEEMNRILHIDNFSRFGGDGLYFQEINELFSNSNVNAGVLIAGEEYSKEDVLSIVYHAVELGTPPIVLFGGNNAHAMAVVGHTFDPALWMSKAGGAYFTDSRIGYKSSFNWVDKFIVQDDNFGPYHTVLKNDLMESVFAVVYPRHNLLAKNSHPREAQDLVWRVLSHTNFVEDSNILYWIKQNADKDSLSVWYLRICEALASGNLVLRQTKTTSAAYKDFLNSLDIDENLNLHEIVETKDEWLIVEISLPELYQWNNHRLGEALLSKVHYLDENSQTVTEIPRIEFIRLPGMVIKCSLDQDYRYHIDIVHLAHEKARSHTAIITDI